MIYDMIEQSKHDIHFINKSHYSSGIFTGATAERNRNAEGRTGGKQSQDPLICQLL